jgi:hypothetical protein
MKKFIALSIVCIAFITACNNSDKTIEPKKDKYELTKETLKETEQKNATRFLAITGHDKKNLIGQTVVKGTLVNNAKVVTYKDVEVELAFYSKTGTLLEKDIETIYDALAAGKSNNFKTKYFAPKGTDSVALKVLSAKSE